MPWCRGWPAFFAWEETTGLCKQRACCRDVFCCVVAVAWCAWLVVKFACVFACVYAMVWLPGLLAPRLFIHANELGVAWKEVLCFSVYGSACSEQSVNGLISVCSFSCIALASYYHMCLHAGAWQYASLQGRSLAALATVSRSTGSSRNIIAHPGLC